VPVIPAPPSATHELPGSRFTSLATPSRGSSENAVWMIEVAPGGDAVPHSLTREEIFVVLDGTATVTMDGTTKAAAARDAIVVPAGVEFTLRNTGEDALRLIVCFPVGGRAVLADGTTITPPWSV
jgi:mannose-6-phosphate isomerase-like protein (cupin superfamily)